MTTTNRYATVDLDMKRKALQQAHPAGVTTSAPRWRRTASILEWLEAL